MPRSRASRPTYLASAIAVGTITLAVVASIQAGSAFVQNRVIDWSRSQPLSDYQHAINTLEASRFPAGDSAASGAIAAIYHRVAKDESRPRPHRRDFYQLAKSHYLRQAESRPSWPRSHAYALSAAYFGAEPAPVVMSLLRRAMALGPYEPAVLKRVMYIGLTHFNGWDAEDQRLVRMAATRLLDKDSHGFTWITDKRDAWKMVCPWLMPPPPEMHKHCR